MRSSLLLQAPSGISSLPFGFVYWFCLFLNLHSPTVKKAELSSVWARCELLTYFGTRTCYVASATSFLKLLHRYTDSRPLDKIFSPLKITNLISSYQTIWTKHHSTTPEAESHWSIDSRVRSLVPCFGSQCRAWSLWSRILLVITSTSSSNPPLSPSTGGKPHISRAPATDDLAEQEIRSWW